jgi:hypothetical protein
MSHNSVSNKSSWMDMSSCRTICKHDMYAVCSTKTSVRQKLTTDAHESSSVEKC